MAWKWFLLKSFHEWQLLRCGVVGKPTNIYINYSDEAGSGYTDRCAKGKHEIKIRLKVGANVTERWPTQRKKDKRMIFQRLNKTFQSCLSNIQLKRFHTDI
eukprot:TRINITY_DN1268_c0_g1_i2.p1 TRINITY_DN1268_c0_g1~~TRINITY_DN1268_c0_g1_i2.p1  ORF type:complete len:101 (-),score=8.92 TRINITY_DN1268_c0_g1_i2:191-493(-)